MKLLLSNFCTLLLLFASSDARYSRIYNGTDAKDGMFPFMSFLTYEDKLDGPWKMCGAGIIHPRWAIMAAHCILDDDNPTLTVGTAGDIGTGKTYAVEKFVKHPNYTLVEQEYNNGLEVVFNDIGLLRVNSSIKFDEKVKKIKLQTDEKKNYDNTNATVLGWGRNKYYGRPSDRLRYANVRVMPIAECRKVWTYADKHLCTDNKIKGVCNGDSGSPLIVNGIQIGVTSTTDKYCKSLKPDLYTKVASFIPWIRQTLALHGDTL